MNRVLMMRLLAGAALLREAVVPLTIIAVPVFSIPRCPRCRARRRVT